MSIWYRLEDMRKDCLVASSLFSIPLSNMPFACNISCFLLIMSDGNFNNFGQTSMLLLLAYLVIYLLQFLAVLSRGPVRIISY